MRSRSQRPSFRLRAPILLFTLAVWSGTLSGCDILGLDDDPQRDPKDSETSVLFIGSSYLAFNSVPDRFRDMSEKAGHKVYVRYHLALGQPLSYFAQELGARSAIRAQEWDFVVLQGGAASAAYPSTSKSGSDYLALQELRRMAKENNPATTVVYMMPWAYEDGMTWVEGRTETYEEMQLDLRERTVEWAHELDLVLAPVGMAWYEVLTTWPHDEHFLHDEDQSHASREGSFLTAATLFSTIWVEDGREVDYRWEIEAGMARELRAVAGATVMQSLPLWNLVR